MNLIEKNEILSNKILKLEKIEIVDKSDYRIKRKN